MSITQVLNRFFQTIPVVIGVTLIVFSMLHMTPGDPIELMMGKAGHVAEGEVERLRQEYGLDQPLHIQYLSFLKGIFSGDFGTSLTHKAPVREVIVSRLPATIELTLVAILISLLIALPVGVISAVKRYSILDKFGTVWALLGVSMPEFWLGLVLIIIFSVSFKLLPISGRITYGMAPQHITGLYLVDSLLTGNLTAFWDSLKHLIMPAFTLGSAMAALTMRVTRSSMLGVLNQDYILFARSKGLTQRQVVVKHALKNALIPTVTVVTLNIGILLGGNMIVESVFGWPGLGRLVVEAVYARDYPLVQGAVFVYAITYVGLNFTADVLYTVLNPRVKL